MLLKTERFGNIEYNKQDIIQFFDGLPGFLEEKEFLLLPYQSDSPFFILQSVTEANLAFVLVEPFAFFPKYEFQLEDNLAKELELSEDNPPHVLNIVTIKDKVENMTANLLAPVVISRKKRLGVQLVLENKDYTTKHRLFPEAKQATAKGAEESACIDTKTR